MFDRSIFGRMPVEARSTTVGRLRKTDTCQTARLHHRNLLLDNTMWTSSLVVIVVARCAVGVFVPVYPPDPLMLAPERARHADALLNAANVTWFRCPLTGRVANMMITLADGITYDVDEVYTRSWDKDTLSSPMTNMPIPRSLGFAYMNLDLMDMIKNADLFLRSLQQGHVPEAIGRFIQADKMIWICRDGRSHLAKSFKRPYEVYASGMQLVFTDIDETCFRNLHLERIVDNVCQTVDCSTRPSAKWHVPGGDLVRVGDVSTSGIPHPLMAIMNRPSPPSSQPNPVPVRARIATVHVRRVHRFNPMSCPDPRPRRGGTPHVPVHVHVQHRTRSGTLNAGPGPVSTGPTTVPGPTRRRMVVVMLRRRHAHPQHRALSNPSPARSAASRPGTRTASSQQPAAVPARSQEATVPNVFAQQVPAPTIVATNHRRSMSVAAPAGRRPPRPMQLDQILDNVAYDAAPPSTRVDRLPDRAVDQLVPNAHVHGNVRPPAGAHSGHTVPAGCVDAPDTAN